MRVTAWTTEADVAWAPLKERARALEKVSRRPAPPPNPTSPSRRQPNRLFPVLQPKTRNPNGCAYTRHPIRVPYPLSPAAETPKP